MSDPTQKSFLVRLTDEQHNRIKTAAEANGVSMSDFFRDHALEAAKVILDCSHPLEFRKVYAWSDVCHRCGTRLRG
jgi:uncharacterized protein (DUF1778 family)